MTNEKTQLWKQAIEIYKEISELPVSDAIEHVDSIHNLSYELKQAVITLVNAGNQASQYIDKNFSPQHLNNSPREINYQVGDDLGDYRLLEELGKGGMSYVFKAKRRDVEPQKLVAIKIFSPKSYSPQLLEHFISEQKILSELNHANIVDMLHGGKAEDGATYLVMELIDEALPINKYGQNLTTKEKINLILQCAQALAYSHANLIIHRDLKPDNILIDKTGQLKIVDFGIAKLINNTRATDKTTIMALTPSYAAPEQVNSEKISTKTDIFSLAVVAVELLYGKKFLPKDRLIKSCEKDEQAISVTLKSLNIDKDLKNILHQGLAQNPNDRYPSMQSFADDLNNYLQDLPVTATAQSVFYRLGKFAKRRKALFISLLALLSTLILSLGVTLWQNHQIKIESAKAQSVKQFMLDAFEVTNPNNNQGIQVSANDILLLAAKKLNGNHSLDDEVRFELSQSLGIAYFQLGFVDDATRLLMQSLAIKPANATSLTYLANTYLLGENQHELQKLLTTTDENQFNSPLNAINFALVRAKDLSINGKSQKAIDLIKKVQSNPVLQKYPRENIRVQLALAKVFFERSDYQKSIRILKSILQESDLPPHHTLILSTNLELARTYNIIGEHELSLQILTQLEEEYKNILGENHPDLGGMYKSMASVFRATGQVNKAREYAQKSYQHNVKTFNNKGIAVAESLNMMAVIAFSVDDDLKQAIALTEKGIKVIQQTYGEDHPQLLELKTNYAFLLSQNKQVEEALAILNQIHTIQIKKLGENHFSTIETEGKIIGVLLKLKHYDKAKKMALSHLQKVKKLVNQKNIKTANAYILLAKVYLHTKEKHKRLAVLQEIINSHVVSESEPHFVIMLRNLAQAFHAVGNEEKADEYFHKAINANRKIHPNTHISALKIKIQYAQFLQSINRLDEAKAILIEIKKIAQQENYSETYLHKMIKKLETQKPR